MLHAGVIFMTTNAPLMHLPGFDPYINTGQHRLVPFKGIQYFHCSPPVSSSKGTIAAEQAWILFTLLKPTDTALLTLYNTLMS